MPQVDRPLLPEDRMPELANQESRYWRYRRLGLSHQAGSLKSQKSIYLLFESGKLL